ncbi:DUF3304 domain-containing protein [Aquabacterium sp.]|uniref:DUF3304 domain-containing protein n=1 Tax=Aquabacterium sp. TaxID=1872578 RepID=UPI00248A2B78|nr:DUF3304 domain-containing protein [Aquabacterium sp.]MDI1259923.1 DUF3304 domain-containing protein [Aquabacterium sp.]
MSALLLGCAQAGPPAASTAAVILGEPQSLLIQGYNYTDDYIDSFTVNGQGGGNIFVSGPSSGGGKSVCCASYQPGTALPIKLKVRWVGGYCMEFETSIYGRKNAYRKGLWREAEAQAVDLSNGKPKALEVHIYPDGHVEAAVTQGHSSPRLILPEDDRGERPGVTHNYLNCTHDQLKQSRQ